MTKADFNVALNLQSTRSTVSTRYYYAVANNSRAGPWLIISAQSTSFVCVQVGTQSQGHFFKGVQAQSAHDILELIYQTIFKIQLSLATLVSFHARLSVYLEITLFRWIVEYPLELE